MLEGREIFVPLNVTQHWNKHDFVQVDTTDILFICAGTFSDLHQIQVDRLVGFGSAGRRMGSSRLRVKELIEFGMLAELLGRLPVQVQLEELTADELYRILTVPPDSLAREYREALLLDGVDLELSEGALRAVVEYSVEKKLGARSLRSILEEVLADVMFEAPEKRGERVSLDRKYALARLKRIDAGALRDCPAIDSGRCSRLHAACSPIRSGIGRGRALPSTSGIWRSSCKSWSRTSRWGTWAACRCATRLRLGCRGRPSSIGTRWEPSPTWACSTKER